MNIIQEDKDKEVFHTLKELQKVDLQLYTIKEAIHNQEERLKKIDLLKEKHEENLHLLQEKLKETKLLITNLEAEQEKLYARKQSLHEHSLSNSYSNLEEKIKSELEKITIQVNEAENDLFVLLESQEKDEQKISELKNILLEIPLSRKEIEDDVKNELAQLYKQEEQNRHRFDLLFQDLPSPTQNLTSRLRAKMSVKNPYYLSSIREFQCERCHMSLNRQLTQQVEKTREVQLCTSCNRILLPHNV